MKIILDANIYVSAFFWGGNPRIVLERAISGTDELYITKEILSEIEGVLGRPKFHAGSTEIDYYVKSIEEISNMVMIEKSIKNGSRDKTDNKYLECGIACIADFIISGDIHLLEMKKYKKIKIVTAKEYLDIVQ